MPEAYNFDTMTLDEWVDILAPRYDGLVVCAARRSDGKIYSKGITTFEDEGRGKIETMAVTMIAGIVSSLETEYGCSPDVLLNMVAGIVLFGEGDGKSGEHGAL